MLQIESVHVVNSYRKRNHFHVSISYGFMHYRQQMLLFFAFKLRNLFQRNILFMIAVNLLHIVNVTSVGLYELHLLIDHIE